MSVYLGTQRVDLFGGAGMGNADPELQDKTITPTEGQQVVTADEDYDALSSVTVEAISTTYVGSAVTRRGAQTYTPNNSTQSIPSGVYLTGQQTINPVPTETKSITTNGTVTPTSGKYFSSVTVNVQPSLQTKTATPTEEAQEITADSTYYGLSKVTVGAIDSTYIGSEIPRRTSANLSASGATVSVPSGYYASDTSKSVSTATQATPTVSVDSAGLVTATATQTAGYVSAGTKEGTLQLTTKGATAITPSESQQTAISSGTYATGNITVSAISSTYVGSGITKRTDANLSASGATVTVPAGYYASQATKSVTTGSVTVNTPTVNSSGLVTASATVSAGYIGSSPSNKTLQLTTQTAKTVTPSTSSQTAVSSGTYCTGNITVAAIPSQYITTTDANASASDIVSGQTAYVNGSKVTGSLVIQKYYTGSSIPSASFGNNGDLYLKV